MAYAIGRGLGYPDRDEKYLCVRMVKRGLVTVCALRHGSLARIRVVLEVRNCYEKLHGAHPWLPLMGMHLTCGKHEYSFQLKGYVSSCKTRSTQTMCTWFPVGAQYVEIL